MGVQHCLNVWFLIEVILRMYAHGLKLLANLRMTRILRLLRLVRLLRALRVFRVARLLTDFRKMVYALSSSGKTLLFSMVLLAFEIYFFAICFVQAVNNYKSDN